MGMGLVCSALHQKNIELNRVWWSGELEKAAWRTREAAAAWEI
jgi:hypothetical protein